MEDRRANKGLFWLSRLLIVGVVLCGLFLAFLVLLWVLVKVERWLAF